MELSGPQVTRSVRWKLAADRDLAPVGILNIPAELRHLWEPGNPYLYDLRISLIDARAIRSIRPSVMPACAVL